MADKFKVAIICPSYSNDAKDAYGFVHARAKLYLKSGLQVTVFVISNTSIEYTFEGIKVINGSIRQLIFEIRTFDPSVLAIHFAHYRIIGLVNKLQYPKVVWVHGHEILWNFRLRSSKNLIDFVKKRIVIIPREIYQKYKIRNFLKVVEFNVFVSNWMLENAEKHTFTKYPRAIVIPNPVDTDLFVYRTPESLDKAITLRSLDGSKYGIDIAIKAFSHMTVSYIHIVGKGRFKNRFQRMINKNKSSAQIIGASFKHNELPKLFHNYGFFVAPSRVEAQGLAMCEAMACGLPVIATNVGGIPEFVRDGIDGYLVPPNNPVALANAVKRLLKDKNRFLRMSKNAREQIIKKCDSNKIISAEIELLKRAEKSN